MNLLCKLLGQKWRDTSYYEFKRKNGKQVRRRIAQITCYRCEETSVKQTGAWENENQRPDKTTVRDQTTK